MYGNNRSSLADIEKRVLDINKSTHKNAMLVIDDDLHHFKSGEISSRASQCLLDFVLWRKGQQGVIDVIVPNFALCI